MASPIDIARQVAGLDEEGVDHVKLLLRSWGLLADLALGDILLLLPTNPAGDSFVVTANVRPSTGTTLYTHDPVGDRHKREKRPHVAQAWDDGGLRRAEVELGPHFPEGKAKIMAAPLSLNGRRLGVVLRERRFFDRELLQLEETYLKLSNRIMAMVASGDFPFAGGDEPQYGAPRVGDGLLVLDDQRRVVIQSPNAVSALHRLGIHRPPSTLRVDELGLDDSFVRTAYATGLAVTQEIERRNVTVTSRCIPLLVDGEVDGGFILMRDVSELKRRDRMLVSKDATIREIHHRVKNNLQTISSLLRLQARRVESEEGRAALHESVRRIGAIAIVHETLANDQAEDASGDDAPFEDVARPLIRMIEEGLQSPDNPIRFRLEGEAGRLPLIRSIPLAVVLTELLQNVVDHAFPGGAESDEGKAVTVSFEGDEDQLSMTVSDNGTGPPASFDFANAQGLGLTLVNTFVTTELNGTITMSSGDGPAAMRGTSTTVRIPRAWEDRTAGPAIGG